MWKTPTRKYSVSSMVPSGLTHCIFMQIWGKREKNNHQNISKYYGKAGNVASLAKGSEFLVGWE